MVTVQELQDNEEYNDICEDVYEECSQYGKVISVIIPRTREGYSKSSEGNIYVQFADINIAQRAVSVLSGKKFQDRVVIARFVSYKLKLLLKCICI